MEKAYGALKKISENLTSKTKLNPRILIVALLLVSGILLLGVSELSEKNETENISEETTHIKNSREYEAELENRLVTLISAIEGAGETRVMVTLESGSEQVYLNNSDYGESVDGNGESDLEKKDDYVIVDNPSGQGGIVVRTAEPRVRGVAVVCKGAGTQSVKLQIVETVTALLDISSARVSVAEMKD